MKKNGFTLLEVLAVIAMTGILSSVAFGSYSQHLHRKNEALATKEVYRIAQELESYRGNNFSYSGFSTSSLVVPSGATGARIKYNIEVLDGSGNNPSISSSSAVGRDYIIRAISTSTRESYSYLYTSKGMRCKNKIASLVTATGCGTATQGSLSW